MLLRVTVGTVGLQQLQLQALALIAPLQLGPSTPPLRKICASRARAVSLLNPMPRYKTQSQVVQGMLHVRLLQTISPRLLQLVFPTGYGVKCRGAVECGLIQRLTRLLARSFTQLDAILEATTNVAPTSCNKVSLCKSADAVYLVTAHQIFQFQF